MALGAAAVRLFANGEGIATVDENFNYTTGVPFSIPTPESIDLLRNLQEKNPGVTFTVKEVKPVEE